MKKKTEIELTPEQACMKRRQRERVIKSWLYLIVKIVLITAAVYVMMTQVFGLTVIEDEYMYPSLRDGDIALFYRLNNEYRVGDIVTFRKGNTRYTGRVAASGADTVDMTEAGELLVNAQIRTEAVFYPTYKNGSDIGYPLTVPDEAVFLLGDMRTEAADSRDYGPVPVSAIDGLVFCVIRRRGL